MWDIAIDPTTGDFIFDSRRDLGAVTGTALVDQRILTRCKIPRGTFSMDKEGTLGSTLHQVTRFHSDIDADNAEAEAAVEEAIEPMPDIRVIEIFSEIVEKKRLIHIHWQNESAEGEVSEEEFESATTLPQFSTTVPISGGED